MINVGPISTYLVTWNLLVQAWNRSPKKPIRHVPSVSCGKKHRGKLQSKSAGP